MEHLIKEILVEEEEIRKRVAELGAKITEDYKG
ncbi:MAG: hypoxanthine phosphoribosyltransferase, partial [Tissierellia bacterium]|nr:hypoxanthine phosphoribosyltransferase [Tissierellia bacterium]